MGAPTVEELRRAVEELAQPAGFIAAVVLFGSMARGEAGEDSDIDLFVVTKGLRGLPRYRRTLAVYEALSGLLRSFGRDVTVVDMELDDFLALERIRPLMLGMATNSVGRSDRVRR